MNHKPTHTSLLLRPIDIMNGNTDILDKKENPTEPLDTESKLKPFIKRIKTNYTIPPVSVREFPKAYHEYYHQMSDKLLKLREEFDTKQKTLTQKIVNNHLKEATKKFSGQQLHIQRFNNNPEHHTNVILNVLLCIIKTINSTPVENISKQAVNRKINGMKKVKSPQKKDKAYYQKQRNKKIQFFQEYGGVIMTLLFTIVIRKINPEWRNEPQTKEETLKYFTEELTEQKAKKILKSFIEEQRTAHHLLKLYRSPVPKTSFTVDSDFHFMIRQAKKRIDNSQSTQQKLMPQPMQPVISVLSKQ